MHRRLGTGLAAFGVAWLVASLTLAQPPGPPEDEPPPPRGAGGPGPGGPYGGPARGGPQMLPASPLMVVLDTDGNGVLSAAEIKNAARSLEKLDTNHDGKIDRAELRPRLAGALRPRPDGPVGRAPRGDGRPPREDGPPGPAARRRDPVRGGEDAEGPPEDDGPPGPGARRRGPGGPPPRPDRDRPETDKPAHPTPSLGKVFPPGVEHELDLTEKQAKQIAELEANVAEKLKSILGKDKTRQLEQMLERQGDHRLPGPPPDDEDRPQPPPRRR